MEAKNKISVIIPTYNEESVISSCLRSLDKQKNTNFEVIVIDDGSLDDTLGVVRELGIQNYELKILEQKHKGPGEARNLGAKSATGEILVFVDADMTFDVDFIDKLTKPIATVKSKGTFSKQEYVSNWDNIWARCWNLNEGWRGRKRHAETHPNTQRVFRAILKSEFDRVGGFDSGGHYTDDYLSDKLGYEATLAQGAKSYHENPDNLKEVFTQAKWAGKRKYKFGIFGLIVALIRSSFPFSIVIGTAKSIINFQPVFFIFKITYDLGSFLGILEYLLFKKSAK